MDAAVSRSDVGARRALDLTGQGVLITGGAGALGVVISRRLVEHGATVVVNDVLDSAAARRPAGASPERLPAAAHYIQADACVSGDVERLLEETARILHGLPDLVCCHAGIVASHPVHQTPVEDFDAVLGLNLRAAHLVAAATVRRWLAADRGGSLLFTSSWVQDVPWPGIAAYSASKAAVRSLMRSYARELAPQGIRANSIAPGIVGVGMARHQWDTDPQYRSRAAKAVPLGQLQTPESVADAFLFMASPLSSYMTGSTLLVDGGASLYPMD